MERILLIRLKAIGDVIFTLPAVSALRQHYPSAQISFLTSAENASLLRGFKHVQETIALDRAALRSRNPWRMGREMIGLLWRLRRGKFSLVVDFQGFGETAWLARLTGAPQRWGSVYGRGRRWAYTLPVTRNEKVHPADWNLELINAGGVKAFAPANEFSLPADSLAAARAFFAAHSLQESRPTLLIQPFTSSAQKNWPLENFLNVARHWREVGVQVIFVGGPADAAALQPAGAEQFCVSTKLPLLGSAGLAQLSTLVLGGDTGLGHLAVAQGRRVLMLMRHVKPGACLPYKHSDWAIEPARPSHLEELSLSAVLAETGRILNPHARNASC